MPFGDIEIILDKGPDGGDEACFHLLELRKGKLRHEVEVLNPILPSVDALVERITGQREGKIIGYGEFEYNVFQLKYLKGCMSRETKSGWYPRK